MKNSSISNDYLLIQTAFVGDLLLSIPLLKEMKRLAGADGKVALVCRKGLGGFLKSAGLVDEVFEIEKGGAADADSWKRARTALAKRKFAVIFCPHESFRSAIFASRIQAARKIGFHRRLNFFAFTDRIVRPMHLPEAMRQLSLLAPIESAWGEKLTEYATQTQMGGLKETELAEVPAWADMSIPHFQRIKTDRESASAKVVKLIGQSSRPIAVLAPGSVWKTKMWVLDGYTRVARELQVKGYRVLALGAGNEIEICKELARRAPGVEIVAGETNLFESTELIALAQLIVCNDSGAMHMAATAGTPSVAIFGPTVLRFGYRPWQNQAVVVQTNLDCRPCGKHGTQVCPVGTHACMKKVSAEEVLSAVQKLTRPSNLER